MLVWKAISSMTLMILPISSELDLIASIALTRSPISCADCSAVPRASAVNSLDWPALAALRLVIVAISSSAAEVSSIDAAWVAEPWARFWLAVATSVAAWVTSLLLACNTATPSARRRLSRTACSTPVTSTSSKVRPVSKVSVCMSSPKPACERPSSSAATMPTVSINRR
jgi:hypothetical protein